MSPAGFPHSDTLESQLGCQLLEDYRRLLRPSSAPGAKAFTVCPYKLATQHNKPDQHPHTRRHYGCRPQNTKMLASTMQFSSNEQTPTPTPTTHPNPAPTGTTTEQFDGRPAHRDNTHPTPHRAGRLFPQDPTACHDPPPQPRTTLSCQTNPAVLTRPQPQDEQASCRRSTHEQPPHTRTVRAQPPRPSPATRQRHEQEPSAP
jgi:hypothetical protein